MMLNRWYLSLNDREKLLVALGSGVTLILLLLLIWRPLTSSNQQLLKSIDSKTLQLGKMTQMAQQIQQYRSNSTGSAASGSLQQRVTQSAAELNVGLSRLQSSSEGTLQLWIDRVEFNALLQLIDRLAKLGVSLDKLNLQPLAESGYSKAKLSLVEH